MVDVGFVWAYRWIVAPGSNERSGKEGVMESLFSHLVLLESIVPFPVFSDGKNGRVDASKYLSRSRYSVFRVRRTLEDHSSHHPLLQTSPEANT